MFIGQRLDIKEYLTRFIFREDSEPQSLFPSLNQKTRIEYARINGQLIPRYINEFWTSKQRQACSIHEISYRACFKPQLPRFFVELLTQEGDTVYDPFSGRGTTVIEAALLGRKIIANDVNPLSAILTGPRLHPPRLAEAGTRLGDIRIDPAAKPDIDLSMFYHPRTLAEIVSIKNYL
ncbi:site-specific DNA-methyltransferase, partial [Candidatus Woesearchaeota archaeon]